MRRPARVLTTLAVPLSFAFMGFGMLVLPPVADAQQAGSIVTFIVPQGTTITDADTDVVVYIGQPQGVTTLGGSCTTDNTTTFPVQNVVITDPGGGRATRFGSLITVSQTTPVPNGTRLDNVTGPIGCGANGISYDKWSGTVR